MPRDVLIVDDSAAIRKILQRVLVQANIPLTKVVEAGDGVEAMAALRVNNVGLIISDFQMPNMDGLQLLSQVKQDPAYQKVNVVMISAEGGHARVTEATSLGAAGHVRKPFTVEQIRQKLAGLV